MSLTDRERAILEFERTWWMADRPKPDAILERFDLSPERYDELLAALVTLPEALDFDPLMVRRFERDRDRRRAARVSVERPPLPNAGRS
jgi:Protein of unknown function (DUF3263)